MPTADHAASSRPDEPALLRIEGPIATITLNRPTAFNAIDLSIAKKLEQLGLEVEASDEVRVLVIEGKGRAFCTGGDLRTIGAAAAADNAKKQSAVISAIKAIGLKDEQISTSNYSVVPEQKYPPNESPITTGYTVTNTVVADVRAVSTVGAIIDAALAHGANLISGLSFYSSNTDAARRAAIASAVEAARADAEAAAKAAHGSLGDLIEIDIGAFSPPIPRPMMMRAAMATGQEETPISPGQESVTAEVTARWRFISTP